LNTWKGKNENRKAAQASFLLRAKNNSLATFGRDIEMLEAK
jgi:fructose-bisphosphate aldolase class 1